MTDWSRPPEVDDDYDEGEPLPGEGPYDPGEDEPSEVRCGDCGAILTTEERGIDWYPGKLPAGYWGGEEFERLLCARCR